MRRKWIRQMAADRYDAPNREKHWQEAWEAKGLFEAREDDLRPKYYVLEMFPYPSGRIHMGHVRNYTMGDVVARYMRAKGHNVLHPMGWDAFGLPAENAAIERGVHPAKWTYDNIATMRGQLKSMGLSLDWSRELATCDLDYYHQQQKLFLDMLAAGLVDRKTRKVNWDPVDRTVLANEQVIDGRGWRSGALIEQREQPEWVFKITDYAQDLLDALQELDRWTEKVRLMQANWIGRSEGLLVWFETVSGSAPKGHEAIEVFSTRPDTLFGASFLAIAPDHPLAKAVAKTNPDASAFIAECQRHGTTAAAVDHLLVGEHGLVDRVPVDLPRLAVDQARFQHVEEQALLLVVIIEVAGGQLACPIERQAHAFELAAHGGDVVVGPFGGMNAALYGRVFRRQAEGVPAHRMQHVVALRAHIAGHDVAHGVVPHMAHMDAA